MRKFFALLGGLAVLFTAFGDDIVVAERLNYRIVMPENPGDSVRTAANELKNFLAKLYTQPITLEPAPVGGTINFLVGFPEAARAAGFPDWPRQKRLPAEFGVFRRGDNILLYGFDTPGVRVLSNSGATGTLSSVYYFLNRYAHVLFFAPGEHGTAFATDPELQLAPGIEWVRGQYALRGVSTATREFSGPEMQLYSRRLLANTPEWYRRDLGYTFLNNWEKRFFKTRPELFAIHGGKRFTGSYPYHFPCLSNPGVLQQVVADLEAQLAADPRKKVIWLGADAPYARCECERCANLPIKEYLKDGDNSEELYTFINKIARAVRKKYPDTVFVTQTKGTSQRFPPQSEPLEPGIIVRILTGRPRHMDYRPMIELAGQWRAAGAAHTILHSYPRYPAWTDKPIMNPRFTVEYFRQFQNAVEGDVRSDLNSGVPLSFCLLNNYAQARALFESDPDAETIIADFCAAAYPGAETEMIEFYKEMEALLGVNSVWEDPMLTSYTPDRLLKPAALLSAAQGKVTDDYWLSRLVKDFAKLQAEAPKSYKRVLTHRALIREYTDTQAARARKLDLTTPGATVKLNFYPLAVRDDFQRGNVTLSADADALTLRFHMAEAHQELLKAQCTRNHQGSIWEDDGVEIMLAPELKNSPYLQIGVNCRGIYRVVERSAENRGLTEIADVPLTTAAKPIADGWQLEVKIPRRLVDRALAGSRIGRIGIFRNRCLNAKEFRQSSSVRPESPDGAYHHLETYSQIALGGGQ